MSEKEKKREGVFVINNRECFALSHFIFRRKVFIGLTVVTQGSNRESYLMGYGLFNSKNSPIVYILCNISNVILYIYI